MKTLKNDYYPYIPHLLTALYAAILIYNLLTRVPYSRSPLFFISLFIMSSSLFLMKSKNTAGLHLFLTSAFMAILNFQSLNLRFPHQSALDYCLLILLEVITIFLLEAPQNICFVCFFSLLTLRNGNLLSTWTNKDEVIITITTLMIILILFNEKKRITQLHTGKIDSMITLHHNTLRVLSKVCEIKDGESADHLKRVEIMVGLLADCLMDQEQYADYLTDQYRNDIRDAAYLHDIGKIGISDRILNKPGKLTAEEFAIVKTHTEIGYSLLQEARKDIHDENIFDMAQEIARHHHERWDGMGYPDGLSGEDIPLSARIMAIVDVYDALISKRPYKKSLSHTEAMEIIKKNAGTSFDPVLVSLFSQHSERIRRMLEKIRRVEKQHSLNYSGS